ncbi:hypothetical protein DASC09_010750 [Saccharomycopsis crataegensis]|uniref:Uncharacterized protein n=1 Tax=Saccharomycopsis crataegensis TaxID=43959 RepID=A0AAV5QH20_9ASCO|nr:hypothetical protein DASC09_010750 [Saccharomycopsis crataegensis]
MILFTYMLSIVNFIHFDSVTDIFGKFFPARFTFSRIIYKWYVDWIDFEQPAPSLSNAMVSMSVISTFLSPVTVDYEPYSEKASLQVGLAGLLLLKPLYLKCQID